MKPPTLPAPLLAFKSALDQVSDGVLLLNTDAELLFMNSQAAQLLGLPSPAVPSLEGQSLWALLPQQKAQRTDMYLACSRSLTEQLPLELETSQLNPQQRLWLRLLPIPEGLLLHLTPLQGELSSLAFYQTQEQLFTQLDDCIAQGHPIQEFLDVSVAGIRAILGVDRVLLYRVEQWEAAHLMAQSTTPQWPADGPWGDRLAWAMHSLPDWKLGSYYPVDHVDHDDLTSSERTQLKLLRVQSQLVVPVFQDQTIWGLLIIHYCREPHTWLESDIELMRKMATKLSIALQHDELRQQVQGLYLDLDQQVQERTTQLQQALDWVAMLNRITDKVRDSLDEGQIMHKAVQELALVMGMGACNAALYDLAQQTSTIYYEYVTTLPRAIGRVAKMADYPEIYNQLLQVQHFQFCSITPHPMRGRVAMLACPIYDNEGVLGDLWLVHNADYAFSDREIRLVQQAANQCAIALRQARLYQESQAQVAELEKINRLKDEFLSTVSHELRTPMTNMKMGILMLDVALKQRQELLEQIIPNVSTPIDGKVAHYLEILRKECERESQLINDLLDLQRLDADSQPIDLKTLELQDWLPQLVDVFRERATNRQQRLRLDVSSDLPPIVTNVPGLERMLAELLNNACKYTPADGEIRVTVRLRHNRIQLEVSNSGVEIPARELPRVFDKFYRVPSNDPWKQGGTGLGLALVRKLAQHLGGDIEADSRDNRTWFTVDMPMVMELRPYAVEAAH